ERIKVALDDLHKAKIRMADEVIVVTDAESYVGDSTKSEIHYAENLGKPVRFWNWDTTQPDADTAYRRASDVIMRELVHGDTAATRSREFANSLASALEQAG